MTVIAEPSAGLLGSQGMTASLASPTPHAGAGEARLGPTDHHPDLRHQGRGPTISPFPDSEPQLVSKNAASPWNGGPTLKWLKGPGWRANE